MSRSSSYKVIVPPNRLAEKAVWNEGDNIVLLEKRAAQWMRVAKDEAKANLIEDVAQLDETMREIVGEKPVLPEQLRSILLLANDIRIQAASFEFSHLTTIASAACQFIDRSPALAAERTDALLVFADAMKAVASHVDGGGTGKTDEELADAAVKMLEAITRA